MTMSFEPAELPPTLERHHSSLVALRDSELVRNSGTEGKTRRGEARRSRVSATHATSTRATPMEWAHPHRRQVESSAMTPAPHDGHPAHSDAAERIRAYASRFHECADKVGHTLMARMAFMTDGVLVSLSVACWRCVLIRVCSCGTVPAFLFLSASQCTSLTRKLFS